MIFNVLKNINENTNEKNVETKKKINWNLELDNIFVRFFFKNPKSLLQEIALAFICKHPN